MVENFFLTRCKTDDVIPLSDPPFPVYNQADLITLTVVSWASHSQPTNPLGKDQFLCSISPV